MIAIASKPIRKRRHTRTRRPRRTGSVHAKPLLYADFSPRVQVGPNLYAGVFATFVGLDWSGTRNTTPIDLGTRSDSFDINTVNGQDFLEKWLDRIKHDLWLNQVEIGHFIFLVREEKQQLCRDAKKVNDQWTTPNKATTLKILGIKYYLALQKIRTIGNADSVSIGDMRGNQTAQEKQALTQPGYSWFSDVHYVADEKDPTKGKAYVFKTIVNLTEVSYIHNHPGANVISANDRVAAGQIVQGLADKEAADSKFAHFYVIQSKKPRGIELNKFLPIYKERK